MGLLVPKRPNLSDPRYGDFAFLCEPLSRHYFPTRQGWALDLDAIAVTVANRLANLIHRLERMQHDATCGASRWYLDNLKDIDIHPNAVWFVKPLQARLWHAVHEHEARRGYECDPRQFGNAVGHTDTERCFVLHGYSTMPFTLTMLPSPTTPDGNLAWWIHSHCWHWYHVE